MEMIMNADDRSWSPYQTKIFDFVANGAGNAVVKAVAGSGKTTTMVKAFGHVPAGLSKIYLAFNKSIAVELGSRGVNARTFHSVTYGPVTKAMKIKTVTADKVRDLIDARFGDDEARMYGAFVNKLVGLAKNAGIGCLIEDTEQNWSDLAAHHDLELDNENADYAKALRYASEMLQRSNVAPSLDFDDLLYLAVKNGIQLPKFDFVGVDEAQDTNAIQRAVIRKMMKPSSRLMAVGDESQAIYGFRGSDSDSIDLIKADFDAIELPLTVSYRCPTSVVEHARQWVTHIEAAPGAPEGRVTSLGDSWKAKDFVPHDLVVCRTTRPLIGLAYQLLTARVPVRIMGKEIGQGLKTLIKKMNCNSIDNLVQRLEVFTAREVEKAMAKKQEQKAEAIRDKSDCVLFLVKSLKETKRNLPGLHEVIDLLFSDAKNTVVLSTIHKAKGLEADTVYWLNSSKCPAPWAKQAWQRQQEVNLCYVATTRARKSLVLIEDLA
jgi:DNA helicase II / ATP-dependent DNA helicase PcrA